MNEYILGRDNKNVDSKGRIFIPKSFGAEYGEKLVIILKEDYLEVKELTIVKKELEELVAELKTAPNIEMLNFYQTKKDYITASISNIVEVDKQGRINLGVELIEKYNLKSGVIIEGVMNGFRIWESNKFLEHQPLNNFKRK